MASDLVFTGTIYGGGLSQPSPMASILLSADGQITVADYGFGASYIFGIGASGAPSLLLERYHLTETRLAATIAGRAGSLSVAEIEAAFASSLIGNHSAQAGYLSLAPSQITAVSLLGVSSGGQDYLVAAPASGAGLTVFTWANGVLTPVQTLADTSETHAGAISDMAWLSVGGQSYVFVGSATEDGVTGYSLDAGGALSAVSGLGKLDSVPLDTVTALGAAQLAGGAYLVVGAAGSSSLTVMAVGAGGALSVTDHVIDDLGTRFAGLTQMAVVSDGDHAFVVVAGSDDGLSLFVLTEWGRLVHLGTLADTGAAVLDNVSALAAVIEGDTLRIFTTASAEAGLGSYSVDLSSFGIVAQATGSSLIGTAGDDILSDGAGSEVLSGGAGRDVFVLRADGKSDTITDIAPGVDRIDLSGWSGFYAASQAQFVPTSDGGILSFGAETLILRSASGQPLTQSDIAQLIAMGGTHVTVTVGPLQSGTLPPPEPDPPPPVNGAAPLIIVGDDLADLISGSSSNDFLDGDGGNDTIYGHAGDDSLLGREGDDWLYGGDGDDTIAAAEGNDVLYGELGNDDLGGGDGDDVLYGGEGNDTLGGGPHNDLLYGEGGHDNMSGGPGDDECYGGEGNDEIAGSYGADRVDGGPGNDNLGGGPGRDILIGGDGDDSLGGGEADDTLLGGAGKDFIAGGYGNDLIDGGTGDDTINSGKGNDRITGGPGLDTFVFNEYFAGETDVITDFADGYDKIRLMGVTPVGGSRFGALDISAHDGGVEISYAGQSIFLEHFWIEDLDASDFIFI
ncbi:calcium-binding protein [Sedimentimonas flavescens]|uniref:calcium-binding protein n=1 Tax=Sedimentimonas flavescens TaxID=2851012 RepID=UPI001C4A291C|nr:calcium-binding protein [Sedimentimonas flavescens]MBW0158232.1 hypothetical protein [Sedimentimonas flavescens]